MRKKLLNATTKGLSFRSYRNFTPKSNQLSFEVCYSVDSLKVQRCQWSHAASVPSEAQDSQKGQKRVPRQERKAMVEAFVNNYRAENAGKFPKISETRKQVGGSHYVIREIVQELEYNSKINSSNSVDKVLVEKQFDKSKLLATANIDIAKDSPIQDDSQSVVSDNNETISTGFEHLEEKRELQTSYMERKLSEEVDNMSTASNHCIAPESNIVEKFSKKPCPSSFNMPNDINTEEAVSTYSDSFAPESPLLQEERKHLSPSSSENDGTGYKKAQGHESDFVHMENLQKVEEKCIKKADCERREQADLEDLSQELSHSSLQVPDDVKSGEALSSFGSVTQERHLLKEEIDQFSAPCVEKSVSGCSEGQGHDSKFVDMEKHSAFEKRSFEKGYERIDQDAVNDLKHKIEQSQRSLELDQSKMDSSNKRETSVAKGSEKSILWGNLKSFATGIINIWKKS